MRRRHSTSTSTESAICNRQLAVSNEPRPRPRPRAGVATFLALTSILLGAAALRLHRLDESWLWFDEIFGATFASLNLFDSTIAAARFDIHPPVWCYQLQAWALFGLSDQWLLTNSVVWSVAGVLSLYWTVERVHGRRVAMIAAVLLAVLPVSVAYARFLRMYAMLMTLSVWAWYFNDRALRAVNGGTVGTGGTSRTSGTAEAGPAGERGTGTRRWLVGAALCELLIAYSHGIGILVNGYLVLFGLLVAVSERPARSRLYRWFGMQVLVGGLSLGGLINGVIRQVTHTSVPTLAELQATLADFWFAPHWGSVPAAQWGALGLCLVIAASAVWFRRGRETTLALFVAPLLGTVLVSYLVRPIWHLHALLFAVPFAALALALIIDQLASGVGKEGAAGTGQESGGGGGGGRPGWLRGSGRLSRAILTCALAVPFALFSVHHVRQFEKQTDYPGIVARVEANAEASDVVFVPEHPDYWAVARYAVGPEWGSPLKIQPLEPTEDRWGALLTRIGPQWRARLSLEPESRFIEHEGVKYVIGESSEPFILEERPPRIFLIRSRTTDDYDLPGYELADRQQHNGVQLLVFHRLEAS